jgi:hypothetical protein
MKESEEHTTEAQALSIVLMTRQGDPFGVDVLAEFKRRGYPIPIAILEVNSFRRRLSRFRRLLRQLGPIRLLRRIGDRAFQLVRQQLRRGCLESERGRTYEDLCETIIWVDNVNESQRILRDVGPDIIVLGGARILKKEVIQIPRIGILNAHPGLLPQYRGLDVMEWAILNGDDIGVTIHFVDEGIDTGPIVVKKRLAIQPGNRLSDLKKKASDLGVQTLLEAVDLIAAGKASPQPQKEEEGKLYGSMPRSLRKEVDRRLTDRNASINEKETKEHGVSVG